MNDRLNANKPQPPEGKGKAAATNKDLDVEIKKEDPGFFGSFWKPGTPAKKKAGASTMEAVSNIYLIVVDVDSIYGAMLAIASACYQTPSCFE